MKLHPIVKPHPIVRDTIVRAVCVLLVIAVVAPVHADQPLSKPTSSQAPLINVPLIDAPFGRLFTSPQERQAMDSARRQGKSIHPQVSGVDEETGVIKKSDTSESARSAHQPVKLMGVLLRADGQNKVWLSGANDRKVEGDRRQSAKVQVPLHSVNSAAILKPGQVWNSTKGRAEETYLLPVPKPTVEEPTTKLPPIKAASSAASETSASSSAASAATSSVK